MDPLNSRDIEWALAVPADMRAQNFDRVARAKPGYPFPFTSQRLKIEDGVRQRPLQIG
jgi:hypothetical protein